MDLLKAELARKRKLKEQDFGGSKFVKRGDLEKKELERLRKEEDVERQAKAAKMKAVSADANKVDKSSAGPGTTENGRRHSQGDEELERLVLPRGEVILRMRQLKHPATLFGEDDDARLSRLKALIKAGASVDPDSEMMEGQKNDFLRDIIELRRSEKAAARGEQKKDKQPKEKKQPGGEAAASGDEAGSSGISEDADDDGEDAAKLRANFDELCEEDRILVFFKRLLREWTRELSERPAVARRTAQGKKDLATCKQCKRYLAPMLDMLRKKRLAGDIQLALVKIVRLCMERDYLEAMDVYIKLSIGNAPWPIGVTMVGIHERSAREKIHTASVAHVMNDETTRKYLQSVKRLMTFCQRKYPSAPSKSVEFNSLANGSDLKSLLQEDLMKKGSKNAADRLRLLTDGREATA